MTPKLYKKLIKFLAEGKSERFYYLYIWRNKVKPKVLARDRNECQRCKRKGKYSKAEAIHHIIELEEDPTKALNTDNLISLCKACHNELHNRSFKAKKKFKNTERW